MTTLYAVLAGAVVGLGVAIGIAALQVTAGSYRVRVPGSVARVPLRPVLAGVVTGALAWWSTDWPVAGVAVAVIMGAVLHGRIKGRTPSPIVRLEALEDWVRRLADILRAGQGLEQAIGQSRRAAPAALTAEIDALDTRLRAHWPTEQALRAFADDIADIGGAGGDLAVSVLILAARRRGGRLADVLDGLAGSLHDELSMRRQVEADRAKPRTTARLVLILTGVAAAALALLRPAFLEPYATLTGQLVLLMLAAAGAGLWLWLRALAIGAPEPRFLAPAHNQPAESEPSL